MNLGERIYRLRTEKNLSQGDLAEMLDVSRQSISKWENNSAVPDLDKIVKLSEIFGISLDALVKGECAEESTTVKNDTHTYTSPFPPRMIAGTILYCMAFIVAVLFLAVGGGLVGLVLALPFLGCGTICFVCKQNIGLWCCWLLYLLLDIYMRLATGTHYSSLIAIVKNSVFYGKTWTIHAIVSLVLLLLLLALAVVTFGRFWKKPLEKNKKNLGWIVLAWLAFLVVQTILLILPYTGVYNHVLLHILSVGSIFQLAYAVVEWCRNVAFLFTLTNTVRYLRSGKKAKTDKATADLSAREEK